MRDKYEELRQLAIKFGNLHPDTEGPLHQIVGSLPGVFYQQLAPFIALEATIEIDRLKSELEAERAEKRGYEKALQQIVDEIPENEHQNWYHHHHYLCIANRALSNTSTAPTEADDHE